jgi:hypothetical protein
MEVLPNFRAFSKLHDVYTQKTVLFILDEGIHKTFAGGGG